MIKVILCGASGKMGGFIASQIANESNMEIVAGVDRVNNGASFPIFLRFSDITVSADIIIDFSSTALLDDIIEYATAKKIPAVLATTGYSDTQIEKIHNASKTIPIFFTFNMSIGVNLICSLAKKAASILGSDYDIEIVEKHHNQKIDAPSGTAIMLANAINSEFDDKLNYEYDRHSKRQKRSKNEIGIHSIRGGTIVGEHDVIFAGHDEVITISHSAQSKELFAIGAIRAAKFLFNKTPGLYDMNAIMQFD